MSNTVLFAILLLSPLIGFMFNGIRWKSHNAYLAGTVATVAAGISFVCSVILVSKLFGADAVPSVGAKFYEWMTIGGFNVTAGFVIDHISAIMVLMLYG